MLKQFHPDKKGDLKNANEFTKYQVINMILLALLVACFISITIIMIVLAVRTSGFTDFQDEIMSNMHSIRTETHATTSEINSALRLTSAILSSHPEMVTSLERAVSGLEGDFNRTITSADRIEFIEKLKKIPTEAMERLRQVDLFLRFASEFMQNTKVMFDETSSSLNLLANKTIEIEEKIKSLQEIKISF